MAIRKIVIVPDEILRQKTEKVTVFDQSLQDLAQDLIDTVRNAQEPEGAGLSANQIGVSKSVCVVRKFREDVDGQPSTEEAEIIVMVNPKIIKASKETEADWEGCLSIPDKYGRVRRPKKIKVKYQDTTGRQRTINMSNFFARVVQHEIDHLNGILFTDKVQGRLVNDDYFN